MSLKAVKFVVKQFLLLTLLISITSCTVLQPKVTEDVNQRFDALLEDMAKEALMNSPLSATFTLGNLQEEGLDELASQLDHLSLDAIQEGIRLANNDLKALKEINIADLTQEQQKNYSLAEFNLTLGINRWKYLYSQNLIQASSGVQVDIPLALMQIEFEEKAEIDAFILRVQELPRLIDEVIGYEQERFSKGYGLPGYIYKDVEKQIEDMLVEPENFMMMLSFSERIDQYEGLTEEERVNYKKTYLDIIQNQIYPALEKLKTQAINMESSKATGSISEWPDGKAYYEDLVAYMTSDELDVEGLEDWATEEINSITQQFQQIIEENPTLLDTDFENALPSFQDMEAIRAAINEVYQREFYDYDITFASENSIPEYLEDTLAAGFYFPITVDGEDYGNMYLQNKDYEQPTADTLMLYYHENIPGHHLYFSYIANSEEPLYRKMNEYLAYEEGWATYCQNLSFESMGLSDELARFFKLNSDYSNAFMVLMDIQLHYNGMSVEEIKEQFIGMGYTQDSVDSIVDRMISKPGETIHYMYGNDKMNQWKKQFQEARGESFDVKEFHDFVLSHYGLPFYVVEGELDKVLTNE